MSPQATVAGESKQADKASTAASRWRKLRALSWPERWLLGQAMILLPVSAAALRLFGLRRCLRALVRLAPRKSTSATKMAEDSIQLVWRVARIVGAAARYGILKASCLEESLVLWWLLCHRGLRPALRVGVRSDSGHARAHAWVELAGLSLNDAEDAQHYHPFDGDLARLVVEQR